MYPAVTVEEARSAPPSFWSSRAPEAIRVSVPVGCPAASRPAGTGFAPSGPRVSQAPGGCPEEADDGAAVGPADDGSAGSSLFSPFAVFSASSALLRASSLRADSSCFVP